MYSSFFISAGIPPFLLNVHGPRVESDDHKVAVSKPSQNGAAKVSFEDYHKTWTTIATSKSTSEAKDVESDFDIQDDHYGFIQSELEDELRKQMSDHNAVMYGRFSKKSSRASRKIAELKATKLQLMKQLYLRKQGKSYGMCCIAKLRLSEP